MGTSSLPLFGGNNPYVSNSSNMFGLDPRSMMIQAKPGTNQYGNFGLSATPGNTSTGAAVTPGNTGIGFGSPPTGTPVTSTGIPLSYQPGMGYNQNQLTGIPVGASTGLGKGSGSQTVPTFDPVFTSQFYSWLNSQLGQGATPYSGTTQLPGGGTTSAGQLTAPLNTPEQQLLNFYTTGTGGPTGFSTLGQMSQGINTMPEYQAMVAAMNGPQGPVAQQYANLKQQFASQGDIASSPYAQAMTQFGEQTALNQESLMAQLMMQGLGLQQQAATTLAGGAQQFGGALQSYDQQAIQNQLQEFLRTQPEYSPLLNMLYGGATSSPGVFSTTKGTGLAGALSGMGSLAGGLGGLLGTSTGGGGTIIGDIMGALTSI